MDGKKGTRIIIPTREEKKTMQIGKHENGLGNVS